MVKADNHYPLDLGPHQLRPMSWPSHSTGWDSHLCPPGGAALGQRACRQGQSSAAGHLGELALELTRGRLPGDSESRCKHCGEARKPWNMATERVKQKSAAAPCNHVGGTAPRRTLARRPVEAFDDLCQQRLISVTSDHAHQGVTSRGTGGDQAGVPRYSVISTHFSISLKLLKKIKLLLFIERGFSTRRTSPTRVVHEIYAHS